MLSNVKKDKLSMLMDENIDKMIGNNKIKKCIGSTSSTVNEMGTAESYFYYLDKHQNELGKNKITVMMQVGSFYEVYGYIKEDGTQVGNVWDVAYDAELQIANKNCSVFEKGNQLVMAGVKQEYVDRYIDKLVDRHGWTIALYEQIKNETGKGHTRILKHVISPGIYFDNDNISNVFMYIYIKTFKNRRLTTAGYSVYSVNYGVFYMDCISGNSAVIELHSDNCDNVSVEMSELLKIITIQNPKEIVIHRDMNIVGGVGVDIIKQFGKSDLHTNLMLYERNVKYIDDIVNSNYERSEYQRHLLRNVYGDSNIDIFVKLNLVGSDYARIALCLGIDYIKMHNEDMVSNLTHLEVGNKSDDYLMLANNCLYQLDILNKETKMGNSDELTNSDRNQICDSSVNINKITLLDILNTTKTSIGSRKFRQLLSTPITNVDELQKRYDEIEIWCNLQVKFLSSNGDNNLILSPINKIRSILNGIKDIPKFMRKMIAGSIKTNEIYNVEQSLNNIYELYKLVYGYFGEHCSYNLSDEIIIEINNTFNRDICNKFWCNIESNIFNKGYDIRADALQENVDNNSNILNVVLSALERFIDLKGSELTDKQKQKFSYSVKTTGQYGGKHIYINNALYKFITTNSNIKGDDTLELIGDDGIIWRKIKISDLEIKNQKKNYYVVTCDLITNAARSLNNDIDILKDYIQQRFKQWQYDFYIKYKIMLDDMCDFVEWCDIYQAAAYNAIKYGHTKPILGNAADTAYIKANGICHPIVKYISRSEYVLNDIELGPNMHQSGILLYGPNAAGKSTMSKSVGINIIMAQAGFYVACNRMEYKPYHYLFTRIKNNDNIHAGLSSFDVEIRELKIIMDYSNNNSIILGDEILNSTNSIEAESLMSVALIQLHNKGASFMFATHLHNITKIKAIDELDKLSYYHMAVSQNPDNPNIIVYDRKIRPGSGPRNYAIMICDKLGFGDNFIDMAYKIRNDITSGNVLQHKMEDGMTQLTELKSSKYNKEIIIERCQVCSDIAVDVHHISEQHTADSTGYITKCNSITNNISSIQYFHKNNIHNLVSLCKSCHQSVHSTPQKLIIHGYNTTNHGELLSFEWINNNPPSYTSIITNSTNYSNSNSNNNTKSESNNDFDITHIINELKNNGKSIKSIQYTLNKQYNIKMKLVDIEALIS